MWSRCPPRHLWTLQQQGLPVLTESVLYSLMHRIWDDFTPKLRLGRLGLVELSALTGCQLTCLVSACLINKCHGPSCRVCLLVCRPFGSNGLDLSVKSKLKFYWFWAATYAILISVDRQPEVNELVYFRDLKRHQREPGETCLQVLGTWNSRNNSVIFQNLQSNCQL